MQHITLEQMADFLECATIEHTVDSGHTITHFGNVGTADSPLRFVLVNDMHGNTELSAG
jgi:hypothetical protein